MVVSASDSSDDISETDSSGFEESVTDVSLSEASTGSTVSAESGEDVLICFTLASPSAA